MVALLARGRVVSGLCCCILKHIVYSPLGGGPAQDGMGDLCGTQKAGDERMMV